MPSMHYSEQNSKDFGVMYVALGYPYLVMAMHSLLTLRRMNPDLPVCVVTNVTQRPPEISFWDSARDVWQYKAGDTSQNRLYKLNIFHDSPFNKTLYLDCDTLVLDDVWAAAHFLDSFDICIHNNPEPPVGRQADVEVPIWDGVWRMRDLPTWNSGVVMFRKSEEAERFFECWNANYACIGVKFDQPALVKTIVETDAKVLSLGRPWNRLVLEWTAAEAIGRGPTKVLHYMFAPDSHITRKLLTMERLLFRTYGPADCGVFGDISGLLFTKMRKRSNKLRSLLGTRRNIRYVVDVLRTGMALALHRLRRKL